MYCILVNTHVVGYYSRYSTYLKTFGHNFLHISISFTSYLINVVWHCVHMGSYFLLVLTPTGQYYVFRKGFLYSSHSTEMLYVNSRLNYMQLRPSTGVYYTSTPHSFSPFLGTHTQVIITTGNTNHTKKYITYGRHVCIVLQYVV